jgi:hypothetical protein
VNEATSIAGSDTGRLQEEATKLERYRAEGKASEAAVLGQKGGGETGKPYDDADAGLLLGDARMADGGHDDMHRSPRCILMEKAAVVPGRPAPSPTTEG